MTLDEFVVSMQKQIKEFKEYWKKNTDARRPGEHWPSDLGPADWFEQFMTFDELIPRETGGDAEEER